MKNDLFRKGLVYAIVVLFIGAGVVPSISGNNGINSVINAADNIPNTISRTTIYDGSLSGYVNDTYMNPIEGARVRVYFHGTYEENYSDSSGYYHVTNIPICYCLKNATASKEGYKTEWVLLGITENTTYDFVLTALSCYPVFNGTMGENDWYVSDVYIIFKGSGWESVYYKIDDGGWATYTAPIVISEDGIHLFCWYYIDNEGHQSVVECIEIKIDQTPPVTTIEFGKPYYKDSEGNIYITSDTPIYLNAMDNESGVNATYYRINNGNWDKYVAPFSIPEDCDHRICFYSVDNAGNKETIKNENVSVDNYPPYPVVSPPCPNGNNGWYTSSVFVSFADAKSGILCVWYRVDSGPYRFYYEPILIGGDGYHTFGYLAFDNVGNEGTGSSSVKIDQTPPTTTHNFDGMLGENGWYVSDVIVTLSAEDETSGVDYTMYKIDNDSWITYTEPFNVTEDGEYTIYYYSVDLAGHEEYTREAILKIEKDLIPPETEHDFSGIMGDNDWYVSDVTVTLSAEDNAAGVAYTMYKLDDGEWITYTGPFNVCGDGMHILYYYSVDLAGNVEDVKGPFYFKIDQTDPTINLTIEKIGFRKWLITADVYDETSGVAKLELYLNGELLFEVTEPPYEWEVTNPKKDDKVQAIVYDNAGNAVSKEVTVQSNSQSQSSSVTPIQRSMINMQRR